MNRDILYNLSETIIKFLKRFNDKPIEEIKQYHKYVQIIQEKAEERIKQIKANGTHTWTIWQILVNFFDNHININGLNTAFKREKSSNWIEKQDYMYTVYKNPILNMKKYVYKLYFLQRTCIQNIKQNVKLKLRQTAQ